MQELSAQRFDDLRASLASVRPAVLARSWPLAARFGTEPEASWGPPEVLAHIAEMLPFWLGEVERILDGAPEPVPFGRIADDPVRIGLVGRDRSLPPRVLFDRCDAGLDAWAARLAELTQEQRQRRGLHPRLGELTIDAVAVRFVVTHVAEHLEQLQRALDAG